MSTLSDFGIVAHVVPITTNKTFYWNGEHVLMALYVNRYGSFIGCICREEYSGEIVSMDPNLYEEFINEFNGSFF